MIVVLSLLYIYFSCLAMSTKEQVHVGTANSIGLHRGMWDQEEHCRFLRGVVLFGKDWRQVREVIGTRREKQIQSHYQKYARRVARMVKKIKRRGARLPPDTDLMAETELYRRLFAKEEATPATPSQIRSMILCVCSPSPPSPRRERNIIIHDLQELPEEMFPVTEESGEGLAGHLERSLVEEEVCERSSWSPRARSFVMAVKK